MDSGLRTTVSIPRAFRNGASVATIPSCVFLPSRSLAVALQEKPFSDLRNSGWVAADSLYLGQAKVEKYGSKRAG